MTDTGRAKATKRTTFVTRKDGTEWLRQTVYLSPRLAKRLAIWCAQNDAFLSDIVGQAVEQWLDRAEGGLDVTFGPQRTALLMLNPDRVCAYCEQRVDARGGLNVDHVIPRSRGGTNRIENLVIACRECNEAKRDKTPDEAGMVVRRRMVTR